MLTPDGGHCLHTIATASEYRSASPREAVLIGLSVFLASSELAPQTVRRDDAALRFRGAEGRRCRRRLALHHPTELSCRVVKNRPFGQNHRGGGAQDPGKGRGRWNCYSRRYRHRAPLR